MKELSLLKKITSIIGKEYIGDDCAYLKELGIVITQDSLVEDVHFKKEFITPYQLGYKSAMVNISDIAASGAEPCYITISISIPKNYSEGYIEEFYRGCEVALKPYNIKIVGGDITSSEKLFISICAIGKTADRKISSRKNAKPGHKIITSGVHGSSAAGLKMLLENLTPEEEFVNAHLMPQAQVNFSKQISTKIKEDYAMMDTSDGLFDALFKIGESSNCTMCIDFAKIPYNKKIEQYSANFRDLIFYGGEDYQIIVTVPENILSEIKNYTIIGEVIEKEDCIIKLKDGNNIIKIVDIFQKTFNHFN